MKTPNKLLQVKCTKESFFKAYLEFMRPYHNLASRGRNVAAAILAQYFRLKQVIQDPEVLREVLWSKNSKRDIMTSLGMSQENFLMFLTKLKKSGFLQDGDINPIFIPDINPEENRFTLLALFDWSSPKNPIDNAKQN